MYNLAHIYIFIDKNIKRLDESLNLLIKSAEQNFPPAYDLLCIALIKKNGFNLESIIKNLNNYDQKLVKLQSKIIKIINDRNLLNVTKFEEFSSSYIQKDYLYINDFDYILSSCTNDRNQTNQRKDITESFYEGFGLIE